MKSRWMCVLLTLTAVLDLAALPALAANILVNGNFEAAPLGAGWAQNDGGTGLYPPIVSDSEPGSVPSHSPPNLAWLGGIPSNTMTIYQDVAVPGGMGKLTLSGYFWIKTDEFVPTVYDRLFIDLMTTANVQLESIHQWSNVNENSAWTPFSFVASGSYAGQTVRLMIRAVNDFSYVTSFFLDTIVLDASATVDVSGRVPANGQLSAAMPNPTSGATRMRLELPRPSRVRAAIFDLSGRLVREIADGTLEQGGHELTWDGKSAGGTWAAPGVYLSRVEIDGQAYRRAIVLMR